MASEPTVSTADRLAWWEDARFGLFIHWGLYALPAGEWEGKRIDGLGEWIMRRARIPIAEYEKLAEQFNPVHFDARQIAQMARDAGMKYLVITAKHHDGFCMFRSPSNPYNICDATPFGRDPMHELAAACREAGIRLCFYYSQAQDWHAPGGAGHWEEAEDTGNWHAYAHPPEDFARYLEQVVVPNVRELLTQYGPIGLIWFDTPVAITREQSEMLRDLVHELQPACLVSGRVGHDVGDYGSLGDNQHPAGKLEGNWETPCTLNDTWGFKHYDHNWKSVDFLLNLLVNCASKGVNYLLNVGPTAEGLIPQPSIDRLQEMGQWLRINGESIYGARANPFPYDFDWGRVTCRQGTLYLHVMAWPQDRLELRGLRNRVTGVRLLAGDTLPFTQAHDAARDQHDLVITLPSRAPDARISVIAVDFAGDPDVDQVPLQQGDGSISLPAYIGTVEQQGEAGTRVDRDGSIQGWSSTGIRIHWPLRVRTPGTFRVRVVTTANIHNPANFGTHRIRVDVADDTVEGMAGVVHLNVETTAEPWQFVTSDLGSVRITTAGTHTLTVAATELDANAGAGLTLAAVELSA